MGGERSCQEKRGKLATQKGTAEGGGRSSLPSYAPAHLLSLSTCVKPCGPPMLPKREKIISFQWGQGAEKAEAEG